MSDDPTLTDPDAYSVVFENERVRVLEYRDEPGHRTHPHRHPDSVMYTLSSFSRRIESDGRSVDVELTAGEPAGNARDHVSPASGRSEARNTFL